MKNLVKPFGEFINEDSYNQTDNFDQNADRDDLKSMGFDDRIELSNIDEVAEVIENHFAQNEELVAKWNAFESNLNELIKSFSAKYRYDTGDLANELENLIDYQQYYPMHSSIANEIQKQLILQKRSR